MLRKPAELFALLLFISAFISIPIPPTHGDGGGGGAAEKEEQEQPLELQQLYHAVNEKFAAVGPTAVMENAAQKAQMELFDQLMELPDSEYRYRAVLHYCNSGYSKIESSADYWNGLAERPILEDTSFGKISYNLRYNGKELIVSQLMVSGLPAMDFNGKADPYVEVYLFPDTEEPKITAVHNNKLEASFTETFTFNLSLHHLSTSMKKLVFIVMDKDSVGNPDDPIGQLVIQLDKNLANWTESRHLQAPFGKRKKEMPFNWEQVQNAVSKAEGINNSKSAQGEISMSIEYNAETGVLSIDEIRGRYLPAKDRNTSDPYILFYLSPGYDVQRTETIEKQKPEDEPNFQRRISFVFPKEELASKLLLLVVMDWDRASGDDPIGQVIVPVEKLLLRANGSGIRRNDKSKWQKLQTLQCNSKSKCTSTFLQRSKLPFTGDQLDYEVLKGKAIKERAIKDITNDEEEKNALSSSAEVLQHFRLYQDCVQKLLTEERRGGLNFRNHKLLRRNRHLSPSFKRFFALFVLPRPVMLAQRVLQAIGQMDDDNDDEKEKAGNVRALLEIASTESRQTMEQVRRYLDAFISSAGDDEQQTKPAVGNFQLADVVSEQAPKIWQDVANFLTDRFTITQHSAEDDKPSGNRYLSKMVQAEPKKKLGKLTYRLDYDQGKEKLNVFVVKASGLKAMDREGNTSDPYIKVQLWSETGENDQRMTVVQPKTLDPIYNQHFSFQVKQSVLAKKMLKFAVYDKDEGPKSPDDPIGQVTVPLGDWWARKSSSSTGNKANNVRDVWKHFEVAFIQPKDPGSIKFKLAQNGQGKFQLSALQGIDLAAMDDGKTSDPYIRVTILPDGTVQNAQNSARDKAAGKEQRTKKIKNSLDPKFDDDIFIITPSLSGQQPINNSQQVKLTVYHDQLGKDATIGVAYAPLSAADNSNNSGHRWLQLEPVTHGRINYRLGYNFGEQKLVVDLMKAENLPSKDTNGNSDPFVEVTLVLINAKDEKRELKGTSKVHEKTLDPVFNESLEFNVAFDQIYAGNEPVKQQQQQMVLFNVWDHDRFGKNGLGQLAIPLCDAFASPAWAKHAEYGQWAREHQQHANSAVIDNSKEIKRPTGGQQQSKETAKKLAKHLAVKRTLGQLYFKLDYAFHSYEQVVVEKKPVLTLERAENLPPMDSGSKCDPFVRIQLKNAKGEIVEEYQTKVVKKELNPVFNQKFELNMTIDELRRSSLTFLLLDLDEPTLTNRFVGKKKEKEELFGEMHVELEEFAKEVAERRVKFVDFGLTIVSIREWHNHGGGGIWANLEEPCQNLLEKCFQWLADKTDRAMGNMPVQRAEFNQYLDMALTKDEPETEAQLKQKQQETEENEENGKASIMPGELKLTEKRLNQRLAYFAKQIQKLLKKSCGWTTAKKEEAQFHWLHQILLARHSIDLGQIVAYMGQSERVRMLQRIDRLTGYGKWIGGFYDKVYAHAFRKTLHMENASQLLFFDHFLAKYGEYVHQFMQSMDHYHYQFSVTYVVDTVKALGFIDTQNERLAITVTFHADMSQELLQFESRESLLEGQRQMFLSDVQEEEEYEEELAQGVQRQGKTEQNRDKNDEKTKKENKMDYNGKKAEEAEDNDEERMLDQPLSPSIFLSDLLYTMNQKLIDRLNMLFLGRIRQMEKDHFDASMFKPNKFKVFMEETEGDQVQDEFEWKEWDQHNVGKREFLAALKADHMEVCQLLFRANYLALAIALEWAPVRKGKAPVAINEKNQLVETKDEGDHADEQMEDARIDWLYIPNEGFPTEKVEKQMEEMEERLRGKQLEDIAHTLLRRFNHQIPMISSTASIKSAPTPHYYQIGLALLDKLGYKMDENLAEQMVDEKVHMLQNLVNDVDTHTEDHDEHFTLDQLHYTDQDVQLFNKAADEGASTEEQKQSGVERLLQRMFSWLQRKVERQYRRAKGKRSRFGRYIFGQLHFFCSELAGVFTGKTPKLRFFFRTFMPLGYYGFKLAAMLLKIGKTMITDFWLMMRGKTQEMKLKKRLHEFMKEFRHRFSWSKWQTVKTGVKEWEGTYHGPVEEQERQQLIVIEKFNNESFAVDDDKGNDVDLKAMHRDNVLNNPDGVIEYCQHTVFNNENIADATADADDEIGKYQENPTEDKQKYQSSPAHSSRSKRDIGDGGAYFGTSNSLVRIKRKGRGGGSRSFASSSNGKSSTVASNPPPTTSGNKQSAVLGGGNGSSGQGKTQMATGGHGKSSGKKSSWMVDHKRLAIILWTFGNAVWGLLVTFPLTKGSWHINCHSQEKWYKQLLNVVKKGIFSKKNAGLKFGKKALKFTLKHLFRIKLKKSKKSSNRKHHGHHGGSASSSSSVEDSGSSDDGDKKRRRRKRGVGEVVSTLKAELTGPKCGHYIAMFIALSHVFVYVIGVIVIASWPA